MVGRTAEYKQAAQRTVSGRAGALIALSHDLHAHPETRWQEHRSVQVITSLLRENSFAVETPVRGLDTAFRATFGNGAHRIGLVAEYDALEGIGHACGHNIIAAASVGAALSLAPLAQELDATIEVLGTPAEEGGGGKIRLMENGVFDGLDVAMMVHPGPADVLWARPLAVSHFDVSYAGKAAHAAAYPHLGVNAADAMTIAQVSIGLLRQQLPQSVRVHGILREAGTAPNAIPERIRGSWYVRAADLDELEVIFHKVTRCFEAGALASGCELSIEETSPRYSQFRNDEQLADFFQENASSLGRDMDPEERREGGMNTASTDMGNVSLEIRAIHPYLSINSLPAVNHQKEFADTVTTPDADRAVTDGAYLLAATAVDYLLCGSS
ncbi:M20 family metallopeptidase [Nesterenkonia ebinurensis]|uniref:M20 family metallopeptidase n=1 Tax=Nesterenkonia ebinurensis TaxID=2608252 RepID=UPI00123DC3C3|nr:M20 family metallopeptidase [Nesterenkonia ebinurensis]